MTFELDSASVGKLEVPSALVQVGRVGSVQLLETNADVVASVPNAIEEIAAIPYVPDNVGTALRRLNTNGEMTAKFELALPIKELHEYQKSQHAALSVMRSSRTEGCLSR